MWLTVITLEVALLEVHPFKIKGHGVWYVLPPAGPKT